MTRRVLFHLDDERPVEVVSNGTLIFQGKNGVPVHTSLGTVERLIRRATNNLKQNPSKGPYVTVKSVTIPHEGKIS